MKTAYLGEITTNGETGEINRESLIDCEGEDFEQAAIDCLRGTGVVERYAGQTVFVYVGHGSNRLNLPCIWHRFKCEIGELRTENAKQESR